MTSLIDDPNVFRTTESIFDHFGNVFVRINTLFVINEILYKPVMKSNIIEFLIRSLAMKIMDVFEG